MEDWKAKLRNSVIPYLMAEVGNHLRPRDNELYIWLRAHGMTKLNEISQAEHVVEVMELIDRWRDEDAAKQFCAPPANPFIVERVERKIPCTSYGHLAVMKYDPERINITLQYDIYSPAELRTLAKQLNDLADAHEAIYPPQTEIACAEQHSDDI